MALGLLPIRRVCLQAPVRRVNTHRQTGPIRGHSTRNRVRFRVHFAIGNKRTGLDAVATA
jgi:hypothetical protein